MENTGLDNLAGKAEQFAGDKAQWLKDKYSEIENWASNNTQEGKQKLMDEARQHGLEVNENMQIGEIKNKLKAKLREKFG